MNDLIWILVRYICGEMRMTQEQVVEMLLKEALIARGMMIRDQITEEKTDGTV